MLKKAGIVVASAAAVLVAVTPFAFASDTNNNGSDSSGLINVADLNGAAAGQLCNNDVAVQGGLLQGQVPVKEVTGAIDGALGVLGAAQAGSDVDSNSSRVCGDNTATAGDVAEQNID
ncbi:hypothetical protein SAMN05443637_114194 [Pseudonocardia thermophila]|uniref:Secreted protein n=1 Tax=Pseudonocardia thermophila TaxID=1848 RepID=A0A1M6WIE7_PSETH|nr:hypothetical protein [Pseudonocardia thermophila]SHK93461.1 hypothetical protein SAMN05443637_114194 [Pseudonocardia thermophila]